MAKFGIKNTLIRYLWTRIFKENIVIFEISTLGFAWLENFAKKQKCLNLEPKMSYLSIFKLEFEKTIVIFEISTLEFI